MKLQLITFLLILSFHSVAQIHGDYSRVVKIENINKKIILSDKNTYAEYIYLGKIRLDSCQFDVVRETYNNKLLPTHHGFNLLIFLDFKNKAQFEYEVNFDYQLPYRLNGNKLYFHYFDNKTAKKLDYSTEIQNTLPKLLFISPSDTSERFNPNKAFGDQN